MMACAGKKTAKQAARVRVSKAEGFRYYQISDKEENP
jgi:hypothetical protein